MEDEFQYLSAVGVRTSYFKGIDEEIAEGNTGDLC